MFFDITRVYGNTKFAKIYVLIILRHLRSIYTELV